MQTKSHSWSSQRHGWLKNLVKEKGLGFLRVLFLFEVLLLAAYLKGNGGNDFAS